MSTRINPSTCSTSGRKKIEFTKILEKFTNLKNRTTPKKEFFNTWMIRSIKRCFRKISKDTKATRTAIKPNSDCLIEKKCWETLKTLYLHRKSECDVLSSTSCGPKTKNQTGRSEESEGPQPKSHNNSFVKTFFSNEITQLAFCILTRMFFAVLNRELTTAEKCRILSDRFNFTCCLQESHSDSCISIWECLNNYLTSKYFDQLDTKVCDLTKAYLDIYYSSEMLPEFDRETFLDIFSQPQDGLQFDSRSISLTALDYDIDDYLSEDFR